MVARSATLRGAGVAWVAMGNVMVEAAGDRGNYLQFTPQVGVGSTSVLLIAVGVGAGLVAVLYLLNRWVSGRRQPPARAVQPRREGDFAQEASRLGFKVAEVKTLRLVASRLSPQYPDDLVTSDRGRERLGSSVERLIRRRERELEHLRGILSKLRLIRDQGIRERATVRVETDLAVWIVRKTDGAEAAEATEAAEEQEVFVDVDQVSGRMLDLSEGGAAVAADLEARSQDLVEVWSADPDVWIPPITAGVLQVQRQPGRSPVFHLHFLDPPLAELRVAIQALQRQAGARGH